MSMMRVYVAGAYNNKTVVREVQAIVQTHGHIVTYDWTNGIDVSGIDDQRLQLRTHAEADRWGVEAANLLVIVWDSPTYPYRGTCTEMGIALGKGIRIVSIDLQPPLDTEETTYRRNPFYHLKEIVHLDSLDAFVVWLTSSDCSQTQ